MALHVISARRAFVLLCKEVAEVISVDEGKFNSYNLDSWKSVSLCKVKLGLPEEDRAGWIRTVSLGNRGAKRLSASCVMINYRCRT